MKPKKHVIVRPDEKCLMFTKATLSKHVKDKLIAGEMTLADVKLSHFRKIARYNRLIHKFQYVVKFLHGEEIYLIA